ncbi:MAG TPA: helix-turn-helix transcriptional regulator [Trebonia sp.]|nr:helix-turn-helix transcriptional regulator [Trebonia sp.]
MTVGEALTEARHQAGLSVEELSERIKIRSTVIRSIEQDDFGACGGDLYARGYVRAIAGAVGIDAQPLIREYDLNRSSGANEGASGPVGRHAESYPRATSPETAQTPSDRPAIAQTPTSFDLPAVPQVPPLEQPPVQEPPVQQVPVPPADLYATRYDMPMVTADPAVTSYDLPRVPDDPSAARPPTAEFAATEYPSTEFPVLMPPVPMPPVPAPPVSVPLDGARTRYDLTAVPEEPSPGESEDLMAAGYDLGPAEKPAGANDETRILPATDFGQAPPPAATAWPAPGQASPARQRRRGLFIVAAAVVVVAVGALGFTLASRGGATAASTVSSENASAARASASAAARARASAAARASAGAAAKASASPSATAGTGSQPVTALSVASVMAFGPNGTADGDDPGQAANAIAANATSPWTTQWYDTAKFGMLKHGTGLLLDLGGNVTVTTVRLDLSPYQGADLQLRVGNAEALPNLHVAATANDVGGILKLTLQHPAAARYLLIWFTELPPNGSGQYQETVSHVSVAGRR